MNGRLYDPLLRSFLMPDNFVSDPNNSQNYNRYSYVLNNPMRYTDPNGEEPITLVAIGTAALIGAVIGVVIYTAFTAINSGTFTFAEAGRQGLIGGISGAVTFGIGNAAGNMFTASQWVAKAGFQAVAHGTFQGSLTMVTGGKFWNGFAAGALSSIASSAWSGGGSWKGISGDYGSSGLSQIAFGTVAGGAGASLTGGNFWQGAVTGLVVSGLNHGFHKLKINKLISRAQKEIQEHCNYELDCTPEFSVDQVNEMVNNSPELTRLNSKTQGKLTYELKDYFAKEYGNVLPDCPTEINLFRNAFRSITELFVTVGHETGHVYDNIFLRSTWQPNQTYRNNHSEARSYYWEMNWHPSNQATDMFNKYNKLAPLMGNQKYGN